MPVSNRTRIIEAASLSPGIHLRELSRRLNLSLHAVRYHVEALSKSGLIICDKKSGYSRVYPRGMHNNDLILCSLLRNNSARKILISLLTSDSLLTNKEISERTGLAKSTVSKTVQKLLETRVVRLDLSDSGIGIDLLDPSHVKKLMAEMDQSQTTTVVDNFIELWEF